MTPPSSTQARIWWFAVTFLAIGTIIALLGGCIWGLGRILHLFAPVLWPLAIAAIISYLLDPLVDRLERRNVARNRAIVIVFAAATLLMVGIAGAIVPRLVIETRDLAAKVPGYASQIQERVLEWIDSSRFKFESWKQKVSPSPSPSTNAVPEEPGVTNAVPAQPATPPGDQLERRIAKAAASWLTSALPAIGAWIMDQFTRVAAWFGLLAGIALVPVYCFYFLKEKTGIQRNWTNYLPVHESRIKDEIVFVITSINDYLIVFFRGQVLVAACDALLYTIGFFSVGLGYALLMGLLAGFLSIIPYLGAVLTIVPATILAAVQYRDWLHPLLVIGVFTAVQTIEGLIISPRIIGDRVGLHPLTIIVAVLIGTTLLGGILGGILAIPLTAAFRVLMFRYIWKRRAAEAMAPIDAPKPA